MALFTFEQYQEILRARERMAKGMVKDYGYPQTEDEPQETRIPAYTFTPASRKDWEVLQQLKGRLIHLENKIMEMRASKKTNRYKYI